MWSFFVTVWVGDDHIPLLNKLLVEANSVEDAFVDGFTAGVRTLAQSTSVTAPTSEPRWMRLRVVVEPRGY